MSSNIRIYIRSVQDKFLFFRYVNEFFDYLNEKFSFNSRENFFESNKVSKELNSAKKQYETKKSNIFAEFADEHEIDFIK